MANDPNQPPLTTEDVLFRTLPKPVQDRLTGAAQTTAKTPQQLIRGCFSAHKADVFTLLTDIDCLHLNLFQFQHLVLTLFLDDYLAGLTREVRQP